MLGKLDAEREREVVQDESAHSPTRKAQSSNVLLLYGEYKQRSICVISNDFVIRMLMH